MIVDRLTAESQCYGGIIMGLGFALYEHRILDRNTAQMVNPNMEWYLLPGMSDIPEIDVTLVDQPDRGVVGLGEPPTISTAAAIANAVANAIGVRIRTLPITPQTVLRRSNRSAQEARCEGLCLRQRRQREGSGRGAGGPERGKRAAARRRHGPPRADEGLRRAAGSPRQRQGSRRAPSRKGPGRRAADRRAPSRSPTSPHNADARQLYPALDRGGGRSRHAADSQRRHGRRQPESAPALLVLPQRGVRLPEEGRLALLRRRRREPVSRHLRRRTLPHRPSVEPGGAGDRARCAVPRRRSRRANGKSRRRTTTRCRIGTSWARPCSRRTSS